MKHIASFSKVFAVLSALVLLPMKAFSLGNIGEWPNQISAQSQRTHSGADIGSASDAVEIGSSVAIHELSGVFPQSEMDGENCKIMVSQIESARGGLELSITDKNNRKTDVSVVTDKSRVFRETIKGAATRVRYIVFDQDGNQSFIEIVTYEDLADLSVELSNIRGDSVICSVKE